MDEQNRINNIHSDYLFARFLAAANEGFAKNGKVKVEKKKRSSAENRTPDNQINYIKIYSQEIVMRGLENGNEYVSSV